MMELPIALAGPARDGRLVALWGALSFPLDERPPANRAVALARMVDAAAGPVAVLSGLPRLPPVPILSLDAGRRVEQAFAQTGVPLHVVRGRRDVPMAGRHTLLKLAGDLETRSGVVLSRAEVRDALADADKRYLLEEARRLAAGGALLLIGCDPASADFRAWWAVLAPLFHESVWLGAVGEPAMPWPEGTTFLAGDLDSLAPLLAGLSRRSMARGPIDSTNPPIADIRALLIDALSAQELRRFCQDRPLFRSIVARFGPNQGQDDMVDEVIDYCQTRILWDELLADIEKENPRQYQRFAERLAGG